MNPLAQGQRPQMPDIKDIAPPVYVFPYPLWMVALAVAVLLAVLIGAIWLIRRYPRRPAPVPPTPREIALRALENARARTEQQDPYGFSILVSDILRAYLSAQFSLPATRQTSQEFLAALGRFSREGEAPPELPFAASPKLGRSLALPGSEPDRRLSEPDRRLSEPDRRFTEPEKALLAAFLDKSDRIKFARIEATSADSSMLLQEAVRFVEGARQ